jgi:hypothetical protein
MKFPCIVGKYMLTGISHRNTHLRAHSGDRPVSAMYRNEFTYGGNINRLQTECQKKWWWFGVVCTKQRPLSATARIWIEKLKFAFLWIWFCFKAFWNFRNINLECDMFWAPILSLISLQPAELILVFTVYFHLFLIILWYINLLEILD